MSWSKEKIMAYVDGQLSSEDMIKVEKIINEDQGANAYYEKMILSNDLINLSYSKLENSFEKSKNFSIQIKKEKTEENKSFFGIGTLVISMKGILIFAFGALILAIGTFQLASNKKTSPLDDDYFRVLALETMKSNEEKISTLMARATKDNFIQLENSEIGQISLKLNSVRVGDQIIEGDGIVQDLQKIEGVCSEILMQVRQNDYMVEACKKDKKWRIKYKDVIRLNQLSLK